MRLPEFTAEASFGKTREGYTLTPGALAETGKVLPQFLVHDGDYIIFNICDISGICTGDQVVKVSYKAR
jgi:hypothetical protein